MPTADELLGPGGPLLAKNYKEQSKLNYQQAPWKIKTNLCRTPVRLALQLYRRIVLNEYRHAHVL